MRILYNFSLSMVPFPIMIPKIKTVKSNKMIKSQSSLVNFFIIDNIRALFYYSEKKTYKPFILWDARQTIWFG